MSTAPFLLIILRAVETGIHKPKPAPRRPSNPYLISDYSDPSTQSQEPASRLIENVSGLMNSFKQQVKQELDKMAANEAKRK